MPLLSLLTNLMDPYWIKILFYLKKKYWPQTYEQYSVYFDQHFIKLILYCQNTQKLPQSYDVFEHLCDI